MSKSLSNRSCCFLCAFTLIFSNCVDYRTVKRQITPADSYKTLDTRSPFLKAHMRNGQVYVLSEWSVDSAELFVQGQGALLTVDRDTLSNGEFTVRIDSVAIFETNILQKSSAVNALAIITGISAVVTIACLTNPKACFGSCPTFYVSDGSRPILQAEGFSSSIAPWLEAADIDALFRAKPNGRNFRIEMRNEALETHVVRYVDLLALPKGRGRVLKDIHGKFWQVRAFLSPASCKGPEGDFSSSIEFFDGDERFSMADSANLAERETLEFEFEKIPEGLVGLVIGPDKHCFLLIFCIKHFPGWEITLAIGLPCLVKKSIIHTKVDWEIFSVELKFLCRIKWGTGNTLATPVSMVLWRQICI